MRLSTFEQTNVNAQRDYCEHTQFSFQSCVHQKVLRTWNLKRFKNIPKICHVYKVETKGSERTGEAMTTREDAHDESEKPVSYMLVADTFFYQEIAACLGRAHADAWLADQRLYSLGSSCSSTPGSPPATRRLSGSQQAFSMRFPATFKNERPSASGTATPARRLRCPELASYQYEASSYQYEVPELPKSLLATCENESDENELRSRMLQGHGSKTGLLFTDAAHVLLDSSSQALPRHQARA